MKGTLSFDSENLKSSLGSASYYLCDIECVTSVTFSCLKKSEEMIVVTTQPTSQNCMKREKNEKVYMNAFCKF